MLNGYLSPDEALTDSIQLCRALLSLMNTEPVRKKALASEVNKWYCILLEREKNTLPPLPSTMLGELSGLDESGAFCLRLAFCCEADGNLRNQIQELLGIPIPSMDFACGLFEYLRPGGKAIHMLALADPVHSPLRYLFELESDGNRGPVLFASLQLRENVLRWLCGEALPGGQYTKLYIDKPESFLPLHQAVLETLLYTAKSPDCSLLLTGPHGSGKHTLMRRAAAQQHTPCLFVQCDVLKGLPENTLHALSLELALDAAMSNALLCFCGYLPEQKSLLTILCRELFPGQPFAVLSDMEHCPCPDIGRTVLHRTIGVLNPEDYLAAQAAFCYKNGANPVQPDPFRRLTVGQLRTAWAEISSRRRNRGYAPLESTEFAEAVLSVTEPVPLARTVVCETGLENLVLAPDTSCRLELLTQLLRSRQSRPGRQGVTALFYGPSGTGKTAAAAAIAYELHLELVKIDLSRIMDKYIGETEKHLRELFSAARQRGCILFFDEADSLFSKRTEISSSHDRYANVETSFLLQSIEEYDGAVLLATNLFRNFDDAFLRRIDLLVRFSMPDPARRKALWEATLHMEPDGISFNSLAELELSPAEITLIARNAAALCETPSIPANLLRDFIANELEKRGKRLADTMLF